MMASPTFWTLTTIGGFPYVAAAFFLCLKFLHINDLRCIQPPPEYLPYLAVSVTALSYIIAYTVNLIFQRLANTKSVRRIMKKVRGDDPRPQNATNPEDERLINAPDYALRHESFMYGTLVLYRLLASGIFFLCITLLLWDGSEGYRCAIAVSSLLLTVLLVYAYILHRKAYVRFEVEMDAYKKRAASHLSP
jgi:hypothetical protein